MKPRIYIDGQAGTTGLEILSRLKGRDDIELLIIPEEKRKDLSTRKEYLNKADLVFLCLPDAASIEAVSLIENEHVKVIDASTAHRTNPDWVYGFSELSKDLKHSIQTKKRIANPGCHATGFISIVYPLIEKGILSKSEVLHVFSLTGYSGGGKNMIAQYEESNRDPHLDSPALYGLNLKHKHLKEMQKICHLEQVPLFCPIVDDYYRGMATSILINKNAQEVYAMFQDYYQSGLVHVHAFGYEGNIYANTFAGKDSLEVIVNGHEEQTMITALFDNLGKGACGAAIQNMNLMLGLDEFKGLHI